MHCLVLYENDSGALSIKTKIYSNNQRLLDFSLDYRTRGGDKAVWSSVHLAVPVDKMG